MGLEIGAILPLAGLATFWTGFGFGYFYSGREEARRQVLKLEKRRAIEKTWASGKINQPGERITPGQKPRHVRIQAKGEEATRQSQTRRPEP